MNKLLFLLCIILTPLYHPDVYSIEIQIDATKIDYVSVTYLSDTPISHITLSAATDNARARLWRFSNSAFAVVLENGNEVIRRKDSAAFRTVNFTYPLETKLLPKLYPPVLKYSGGSYLLYTGILHACAESCFPSHVSNFQLSMQVSAQQTIWYQGKNRGPVFRWDSIGDGEMILVANPRGEITERTGFLDPELPSTILETINQDVPVLKEYFETHYGKPEQDYSLFASFDPYVEWGNGYEGGTLQNQIFMHWYGKNWQQSLDRTALLHFVAHELSHFYFGDGFNNEDKDGQWIHEGVAELISIRALQNINRITKADADNLVRQARSDCIELKALSTDKRPISTHLNIKIQYKCGLAYWANIEQMFAKSQLPLTALISALSSKAKQVGIINKNEFYSVLSAFIDPKQTELSLVKLRPEDVIPQTLTLDPILSAR